MKRKEALILAAAGLLALTTALAGCSCEAEPEEKPAGQDYFNGEVIEASDDSVLVRCLDVTSGEVAEGDEVEVSLDVVAAGGAPKVALGDKIRVVCAGVHRQQQETVQLDTVFAIYMLDEDGEPIPN
ncbi:MAG TPA: hypothetical protein IAB13_00305 [Candidatus Avanaerovorax faecigallinarum]|nr:hypothetical protein [Candidatus Avanaerovorax faecigallinarum]